MQCTVMCCGFEACHPDQPFEVLGAAEHALFALAKSAREPRRCLRALLPFLIEVM